MSDSQAIPVNAIFSLESVVSPERRAAIVSRVLNEFPNLPVAARNTFRSAVNEHVMPSSGGFRKGQAGRLLGRDSGSLLQEPVSQASVSSGALAASILQSWSESHSQLKEAVERHLTGRGLTTPGPNLQDKTFRGYWPVDQWDLEKEAFFQTYSDDFDPDDVALMLCYVSGNFPKAADSGPGMGTSGSLNDVLSMSLSRLKELPATAPEWERQIPDFIASVSRMVEEKAAQLRWTEQFDEVIGEAKATFGELLDFFECDTHLWAGARVSPDADPAATLRLAVALGARLAEYAPVHDRASNISEELERGKKRAELQPAIIETLESISALMTVEVGDPGPEQSSPPSATPSYSAEAAETVPNDETEQVGQQPAISAPPLPRDQQPEQPQLPPKPPSDSAPEPLPVVESPKEEPVAGVDNLAALQTENVGLKDNEQALRSENHDLRDEVEALKTELFNSQEREDSWRLAYRSAKDGSLEEVGVAPPVVESVLDAVEIARGRFRQEMVFAPNSESSVEDNPFIDPLRVWEALEWLGTTYYASRMGRIRVTDFDLSIKEACGWWYKSDQGETTVSRYEKSYTTRVDGKRYTLVEHIGKGTTFDARYTIRIAFDWDRDKRQVIVGYIGRHQQTDAS